MSAGILTPKQAAFRDEYRRNIAPWYNGWGHLLSIFVPGIAVIAYCVSQVNAPTLWELLFVIPVLVFYNWNEWWLHKNALHRPIKGILMPVYHRHTHQHHVYFTAQVMTYDTNREWRIVLFPPYALLVFMLLTLPAALVLGYIWSANAGYILMMLTPIYYLNY
ncbi:MAG TPA: fatty acid hydroxylase family protein, partial [Burkholderiales bacterium]|nr:fatty acid hydroxylase family protein [Burkholderiales bacterium]